MTIKLKDAINQRDGDMMIINKEPFIIPSYQFTEEELNSDMTIADGNFFTGLSRVKYTEVSGFVNGKEILFDIAK